MQKQKWTSILLFSLLAVLLINVFHAFFLYQKQYNPLTITYTATADFSTYNWLNVTPKYKDTFNYKTETIRVYANKPTKITAAINERDGIQFLGLYWNGSEKGAFSIKDVSISSGDKTWKMQDLDKFTTYASENVFTETTKQHIIARTSSAEYGWLMIDVLEFEKIARNKSYKPFGWGTAAILFVMLVLIGTFFRERISHCSKQLKVNGTKIYQLRIFLLYLWMVLLPFWVIISHVLLGVSLALAIIHYIARKEDFELNFIKKFIPLFLLFIAITAINAVFHATEVATDFGDYSYFLLAPFLFMGIKKQELLKVFNIFQLAIFTYCSVLLIAIFERYLQLESTYSFSQFFFDTIEQYWHTSYLAGFIIVGLLFHLILKKGVTVMYVAICVLTFVFLYLSQARLPLIIWLLLMFFASLSLVPKNRKKLWFAILAVFAITVSGLLVSSENAREQVVDTFLVNDKQNTDARPELWQAGIQVFKNNTVSGIGRSEIRQELSNQLPAQSEIKNRRYNAHNQYVEFLLAYGFIIPISLLVVILAPMILRLKSATVFVIYFALAMMVESYFSRQSGVVFFSIWYCFFILYDSKSKEHTAAISH